MKFDAHIEALRKGADGNLTMAKDARSNAAKHQKMADDFTAEAVRHEELAQGFDLLADALATGQLTAEELRGIVNGMLSDDPTEAFVDVADAERYAQRDEYVNGDQPDDTEAEAEAAQEAWVEQRESAMDEALDARDAEPTGDFDPAAVDQYHDATVAAAPDFTVGDPVNVSDPSHKHWGRYGKVIGYVYEPDGVVVEYDNLGNTLTVPATSLMRHGDFIALGSAAGARNVAKAAESEA